MNRERKRFRADFSVDLSRVSVSTLPNRNRSCPRRRPMRAAIFRHGRTGLGCNHLATEEEKMRPDRKGHFGILVRDEEPVNEVQLNVKGQLRAELIPPFRSDAKNNLDAVLALT